MSDRTLAGVRLSNPDKILYPDQGITKGALADYYMAIAEHMLPHVARRPITLVRCPAGAETKCFYQRHAGFGVPAQLKTVSVPGFDDPYLYIEDVSGLIALTQMGVLEIHPWGVTVEQVNRPDRMIFDLDPGEGLGFDRVVSAAHEVRARLKEKGLESFLKTTGGKGLHVVVPIIPDQDWPAVKRFAKTLSDEMAEDAPDRYLTRISKAERTGRIFIDYLRNDPTSTAVGPYSTRARPGAPVAFPINWDDADDTLDPSIYSLETVPAKAAERQLDPWREILHLRQGLPPI